LPSPDDGHLPGAARIRDEERTVSKSARLALGLALIAAGFALIALVSTIAGVVVIVVGALVMPWHPGMGAAAGAE
jgi:hypothetical protein